EDRWVGDVEVGLIEKNLRIVLWICLLEAVTFERAPAPIVDALVFPQTGISQINARQIRAVNDDAVGVTAKQSVHGREGERLFRRETKPGGDQVLTADFFEEVSAREDVVQA